MPILTAKNIFLTGGVLYITVLGLVLLLVSSMSSNNYKPYLLVPTVLLLPGLPPSPTFVSKLWATNMLSFGVTIPIMLTVVLINIYLVVTYVTFFIYQPTTLRYEKRNTTCVGGSLVGIWAITIFLLLNPLTSIYH